MSEKPSRRFAAAAQRLNLNPKLVGFARRTRERTLGDDDHIDHLVTARGRPSDRAARQLVALRGDRPGFAGELGLTALQAWQRLSERRKLGGDYFGVDVNIAARLAEAAKPGEVLVSDRTLEALDPDAAKDRRFRAKGAPAKMTAHVVTPR